MDNKEYKYDAFISYRHCELDKFVAEKLHRILETYKLPRGIKKKLNLKNRPIKRVFRDQEELPLTSNLEDPILEALENSKYLIVICSPRLKDSLWCKKEIETFKKLRGRKNIFCVLVEGEPSDSFPKDVLYDEQEVIVNGKTKKQKIMVEPLAADVRGKNKKQVLKKLKSEKLRLIAPMFDLDYDDLKQRHKIWRQKKIINSVIAIAAFCILFSIYSIAMFIKIELQQNVLAKHHALSLVSQSEDYLKKDDRYNAVKLSYQALTDFKEIKMPYTPEAEYALAESLGVYDVGLSYKAINQIKTNGVVNYIKSSPDNKYGVIYDGSEKITLFNTETLDIIAKYNTKEAYTSEDSFSFIGNDIFAYINKKGNISLVNTKTGKQIKEIKKDEYSYKSLKGDSEGKYLAYIDYKKLYIYDVLENKIIGNIVSNEDYFKEMYYSSDDNYLFVETKEQNFDINKQEHMTIHVINIKEAKEINSVTLDAGYISKIITIDDNAYFLLNNIVGTNYTMLIVSYNYINGNINWSKESADDFGKFINRSYKDGTNNIVVVNYDTINVLDASNGNLVQSFNAGSEVINIYSYFNKEIYLVFLANGSVNYINMEYKNSVEYKGKYEFNLNEYSQVVISENGFLLVPKNENRVILYEEKSSKNSKTENIKLDYIKDDSIPYSDYDRVKNDYKLKNKSLITKIFYDTKKEILFVNYTNNDIAIYDVKTKKILKKLDNVGQVNHYFGNDMFGRTYIGDISYSYILDENYNLVGRIKSLCKLEKDKVIIKDNDKYYSIKIYSLDDLLKVAHDYLNNKGV